MIKRVCPKCKKNDINYLPWLGQIWECRKCGWRGPLVIETESRLKKRRKN